VFSFPVERHGFEAAVTFLERYREKEDILIGVEASGPYNLTFSYFLLEQGYTVVELNPYKASQFRKAQGTKAKTDRIDARSLADFLAIGSYQPLGADNPALENLRELTRFRADLITDRTRQINRLKETLSVSFPELYQHLANLDSPTALKLLSTYPGPQALVDAGIENIKVLLSETSRGHFTRAKAEAIFQTASNTVGLVRRQRSLALKLQVITQIILNLNAQINQIEAEIEKIFGSFPYNPSDFPVGGIQGLAAILAEIGDIKRFPTIKRFLSHFGWCPKTFQSGEFSLAHPRMSHAGSPYLRRMIWMLSIHALATVPTFTEYFNKRTANGKKKLHTIVAIGRKLLSIIYAILKTGSPYKTRMQESCSLTPVES